METGVLILSYTVFSLVFFVQSVLLWHFIRMEKHYLAYTNRLFEIVSNLTKTLAESERVQNVHVHVDSLEDEEEDDGESSHENDDKFDTL